MVAVRAAGLSPAGRSGARRRPRRPRDGNRLRHRPQPALPARRSRAAGARLRGRYLGRDAGAGTGTSRPQPVGQCRADQDGCGGLSAAAAARWRDVRPLLQHDATSPHRAAACRDLLRPGGSLVIMDAKLPPGLGGKLVLPFAMWLMKKTMLGNPLIRPWDHLARLTDRFEMHELMFGSYYICRG